MFVNAHSISGLLWAAVFVVIQEEEARHGLPIVRLPLVQASETWHRFTLISLVDFEGSFFLTLTHYERALLF